MGIFMGMSWGCREDVHGDAVGGHGDVMGMFVGEGCGETKCPHQGT